MRKVAWVAFAAFVLESGGEIFAGNLDSGFLKKKPAPPASPAPMATHGPAIKPKKGIELEPGAGDPKNAQSKEASYETIQSLTQILKLTPIGIRRNMLLLNRAAAMNVYGRRLLIGSNQPQTAQRAKDFFHAAIKDVNEVMATNYKNPEQVVRSHGLLGYSYLYLDQSKEAREHFLDVLRLNPNDENAGWIGLYLAEELFDEGKFAEATRYYSGYYNKMSPQAREISLYKSAWCMINVKQEDKAEDLFVRLAQFKSKFGLAKDSMRDLAFLVAHRQNVAPEIQRVENRFADIALKIDFLNYVRESLESQNAITLHSQIIDRLLRIERNREKRLEYLIANFRVHRRLFASREHVSGFSRLSDMMVAEKYGPTAPEVKKFAEPIETEMQILMKSFIDTLAGRVKSPEEFSKEELIRNLKMQFEFFVSYLLDSSMRPQVVNLWMDVCVDASDWKCVDNVTELVLKERKTLASLVERAYIDQLAAIEKLLPDLKGPDREPFEKRKLARMKEFIEQFPNGTQWIRVARQYAHLNLEAGKYQDMIPLLEKIYVKEPNSDAFYRLQFAKFKVLDFQGILADTRWSTIPPTDKKLMDLKRETVLSLALEARKKDDVPGYNKYIATFLQLNPEPQKAIIARVDHLKFLMEKNLWDDSTHEFLAIEPKTRILPDFVEIRQRLWLSGMERGLYPDALKVLDSADPKTSAKDPGFQYRRLLTRLAQGESPKVEDLSAISPQNREYLVGLLAITAPNILIHYLSAQPPKKGESHDLALLALRVKSGVWVIPKTDEAIKLLGESYRFTGPDTAILLPIETRIKKVALPAKDAKPAAFNKGMEKVIVETRKIRGTVAKAIQDKSAYLQLRVLEVARDLERQTGLALMDSPVPAGLIEEQVAQYKDGLREAAKEFIEQAAEFDRLAQTARDAISKLNAAVEARTLARYPMKDWKWPKPYSSDPVLKRVSDAVAAKNFLGALTLLDFLKTDHLKVEPDYFWIRTGVIMSFAESDALRIYLLDELENHQQKDIIEEWKKTVQVPAPEVKK